MCCIVSRTSTPAAEQMMWGEKLQKEHWGREHVGAGMPGWGSAVNIPAHISSAHVPDHPASMRRLAQARMQGAPAWTFRLSPCVCRRPPGMQEDILLCPPASRCFAARLVLSHRGELAAAQGKLMGRLTTRRHAPTPAVRCRTMQALPKVACFFEPGKGGHDYPHAVSCRINNESLADARICCVPAATGMAKLGAGVAPPAACRVGYGTCPDHGTHVQRRIQGTGGHVDKKRRRWIRNFDNAIRQARLRADSKHGRTFNY